MNLLAVARQGRRLGTRLDRVRLRAGDVLLLQCHAQTMRDVLATLACLPLAQRGLRLGQPQRIIPLIAISPRRCSSRPWASSRCKSRSWPRW